MSQQSTIDGVGDGTKIILRRGVQKRVDNKIRCMV